MSNSLKVILIPFAIILLAYLIYYFAFYRDWIYGCVGKISFKSFKALYDMYPERWSLWTGYVEYTKTTEQNPLWETRVSGRVSFNQLDVIKYETWRKHLSKQNEQERKTKEFKVILEELQKTPRNHRIQIHVDFH